MQRPISMSSNKALLLESGTESLQTWIKRPFVGDNLRQQLSKANVLVVPNEGYGDRVDLIYFPSGTAELFQFIRESGMENLSVEICIEDADYKEVALHADILIVATFVVTSLIAPLAVDLISEYIKQRLFCRREDETEVRAKLTVYDEKDKLSIDLTYKGPAPEYRKVMMKALSKLSSQKETTLPKSSKRNHSRRSKSNNKGK